MDPRKYIKIDPLPEKDTVEEELDSGYWADDESGQIPKVVANLYKSSGNERSPKKQKHLPPTVVMPPPAAPAVWTGHQLYATVPTAFMSNLYRTSTGVFSHTPSVNFNASTTISRANSSTSATTTWPTSLPPRHA